MSDFYSGIIDEYPHLSKMRPEDFPEKSGEGIIAQIDKISSLFLKDALIPTDKDIEIVKNAWAAANTELKKEIEERVQNFISGMYNILLEQKDRNYTISIQKLIDKFSFIPKKERSIPADLQEASKYERILSVEEIEQINNKANGWQVLNVYVTTRTFDKDGVLESTVGLIACKVILQDEFSHYGNEPIKITPQFGGRSGSGAWLSKRMRRLNSVNADAVRQLGQSAVKADGHIVYLCFMDEKRDMAGNQAVKRGFPIEGEKKVPYDGSNIDDLILLIEMALKRKLKRTVKI